MTGQESASDADLLRQIQQGKESALEEILRRHQTKIYGLALRMLRNPQDAEEALQDVALTVFQKAGTFRGEAAVSSWMYRITVNACLMKIRRRPKVPDLPLEEELGPSMTEEGMVAAPVADWSNLPRDVLERKEFFLRIEEAMGKLPLEYRAVFLLRDMEELSAQEAVEILGISLPALKSRLHRARLFLRKELSDYVAAMREPVRKAANPGKSDAQVP